MRRELSFALLLALSAASPQTLALGVGEADVRSTLNAPLRAVIPLTDTAGLEPELLRVSVAGSREFDSAGLVRTPLAASVKAEVEVRQGQWVVTLASERPVREPWMDLLLRFDWPSGRQLREVTLLLDPPDYDSMPVLVNGSSRQAESTVRPSATSPEPVSQAASRPVVTRTSGAQADNRAWVGSGDTLWSVAGRLRPDSGIGMNQMMVALVEANPDVFPSGNINAMRAGHALVVPAREAIAARSAAEAERIVQAMNQAWASRGSGTPARVPLGPSTPVDMAAISAAGEAAQSSSSLVELADRAEFGANAEANLPGDDSDATPRLMLLSDEDLVTEASSQVAASVGEENGRTAGALDADVLATFGAGELALGESDPRFALFERRWQESRAALEEVQAERDALQQEIGGLREEVEAMREQLTALLADGAGTEGVAPGNAVVQGGGEPPADAPWWGAVYPASIDRNLILGSAGLAALLGLWLWLRRRRREDVAPSMGGGAMPNMVHGTPPVGDTAPPPGTHTAPIPPIAAGMTVSEGFHQEEVPRTTMPQAEAISEADIFMAYGRFDQARELLEAGLARNPERHDLRLKLLNVHVEQGNQQAAEHEAQLLAETGDSTLVAEAGRLMAKHKPMPPSNGSLASSDGPLQDGVQPTGREVVEPKGDAAEQGAPSAPTEQPQVDFPRIDAVDREDTLSDKVTSQEEPRRDEASNELDDEEPPTEVPRQAPLAERSETTEWRTIDYQPPALEPEPRPREETPMQPSVEFPLMDDIQDAKQGPEHSGARPAEREEEAEWEVEEVAFPPLDRDNGAVLDSSKRNDLERARQLLESGDVERARPLLRRLLEDSSDPQVHDEARDLFTHYRL
ncbi:type IV pilus assembly protein FimV [Billgrantia sp. C5P2]|uniref:type IV pilus assembly protein FimV n=1 Tax=Billgrantia sp. C5P2 TaxID=3436239 RepID=UPI004058871D